MLDRSKLRVFTDDIIKVTQRMGNLSKSVETLTGKKENAGFQQVFFFPQCFQKSLKSALLKFATVWDCIKIFSIQSITCIQRPPKGNNKSCVLQQEVFKWRYC